MTAVISRRDQASRTLIAVGAVLGMAAGVTQAFVGKRIPVWAGAKADPVALGILTLALCALALVGAVSLGHSPEGEWSW